MRRVVLRWINNGLQHSAWEISMGRSFEQREAGREGCFSQEAEGVQGAEERGPGLRINALDDPLDAAVFSALLEMLKKMDKADCKNGKNEIESTSSLQSGLLFQQPIKPETID
jgi:hypothetical protein